MASTLTVEIVAESDALACRQPVDVSDRDGPALLDLQNELVEMVALAVLANGPRDAIRLCQACRVLRTSLAWFRARAERRRLRWAPDATLKHEIGDMGRKLTVGDFERSDPEPWAAGDLLPTEGRSSWSVRVDMSRRNDGNGIWVGVCDAAGRICWALFLYSGRMRRMCRDEAGKLDFDAQPADDLPNGNYKIVMMDEHGKHCSLRGRANGAAVEVVVDHDVGTLGFRVNGGPYLEALPLLDRALPRGMPLRPYASCYYSGDSVSFVGAHL